MGQKGSLSYVWAPVGSRPAMVRDNRHDAVYSFGGICPERGVGAATVLFGLYGCVVRVAAQLGCAS